MKRVIGWFTGIFDDKSGTRPRALVRLVVLLAGAFGFNFDGEQLAAIMVALELLFQGAVASPYGNAE